MAVLTLTPTTGVVVTGGASGIGRACAAALAAVGRPIAVWDRNGDGARATAEQLAVAHGVTTVATPIDVTDAGAIDEAVAEARHALGAIGGVVHAAGIVVPQPVGTIAWPDWDATLAVNLTAEARIVQALVDDLTANAGSAVVGIASIEALVGHGAIPAYCASKAGLVGLTRSLAMQLGPRGVRVNAVCPGYIETPMLAPTLALGEAVRNQLTASGVLGRIGQPDDIGRVVRFLLSDEAAFVTGVALAVDGGVTAID
jgi:NAD(P)-dependent dehydrogenase (short-subunit alcohol dehydrogenase family)